MDLSDLIIISEMLREYGDLSPSSAETSKAARYVERLEEIIHRQFEEMV